MTVLKVRFSLTSKCTRNRRKAASCVRLMFHDCGNEFNGGYQWDEVSKTMLPAETGCDASILFDSEQRNIPGNQGRMSQTVQGACALMIAALCFPRYGVDARLCQHSAFR